MPHQPTRTVFLSSTAKDLTAHRKAVIQAIEKLSGWKCVAMESWPASVRSPEAECRRRLSQCDLFVGLMGMCYGSRLGSGVSYTEMEYDAAGSLGIPRLVFHTPESFAVAAKLLIDDGGMKEQLRFRQDSARDVTIRGFEHAAELANDVVIAIRDWERDGGSNAIDSRRPLTAVIMCGAEAGELWPLSSASPRELVPVAGRPVLDHVLGFVRASTRQMRIVIATRGAYEQTLRAHVRRCGVGATIAVDPPGVGGPVAALGELARTQPGRDMVVLGGDNLFGFELDAFLNAASQAGRSCNALYRWKPQSFDASQLPRYGTVSLGIGGRIVELDEKSNRPRYKDVSTACYYFRAADLAMIPDCLQASQARAPLGAFVRWLVEQGAGITAYVSEAPWFDVGTREQLLRAHWHHLPRTTGRRRGSVRLIPPYYVSPSATIEGECVIGPHAYIGDGVRLVDAEVRGSVVFDHAQVRHARVVDSIVGPATAVRGQVIESVCATAGLGNAHQLRPPSAVGARRASPVTCAKTSRRPSG